MDIAAAVNSAALGALSNATITWVGGSARCVFDAAYADPLGISATRTTVRLLAGPALAEGDAVLVELDSAASPVAYTVREAEPDGRGMVLLALG